MSGPSPQFDVAIVGGGPAGLSAGLVLGRMRRRVLLLDSDDPAHGVSDAVHGFLGHDGAAPDELRGIGRDQLRSYESVSVQTTAVEDVHSGPNGFTVLADDTTTDAAILLLATGRKIELPPIEGVVQAWSRGVYHCPYCHGWELRDRPLAAYGSGAAGLALLLTSLSEDVVLFIDEGSDLAPDDASRLAKAGVLVRDSPVTGVEAKDEGLERIAFADGSTEDRAGLFLVPRYAPSPIPAQLGCELDDSGGVLTDEDGRTSVPGVFAAGDATTQNKAVVLAAAAGSRAAYAINGGLARGELPLAAPGASRTQAAGAPDR